MYTEEEAKGSKWCPYGRFNSYDMENQITVNRGPDGGIHPYCRCIASECMAWRWNDENKKYDDDGMEVGTGYCGLAGKP